MLSDGKVSKFGGLVGQAAAAMRRLETVEAESHSVYGTEEAGREQRPGCKNGR